MVGESPRSKDLPEKVHFLFIVHSHWDREWYLPFEDFRHRLVRVMDNLLDLLEADPSYKSFLLDGQTIVLRDYEEIRGRSERLRRLIREGRILIGPWYVLPDEFLVSGESIIRNLQLGFKIAADFGVKPLPVGYLPDMFGHLAQMPQILKLFGLDRAVAWRGVPAAAGDHEFWWEAPDGSRVLTKFLPQGYGYAANLPRREDLLLERLDQVVLQLGMDGPAPLVLLLCGADHVEPDTQIHCRIQEALQKRPGWTFEFGDLDRLFELIEEKDGTRPVVRGELRSPDRTLILPSVASARLYLKQQDFLATSSLEKYAEPLAALARAEGGPDQTGFLDYAWRLLLENHPHDSICGCSIDQVHDEMMTRYAKAQEVSNRVASESRHHLLGLWGASGLAVFNPNTGTGPLIVTGEIEGRRRHSLTLATASGDEPLEVLETLEPERTLMDVTLDRAAGLTLLGEVVSREIAGLYPAALKLGRKADKLEVRLDVSREPSGADAGKFAEDVAFAMADPAVREVRIVMSKLPRHRVAAALPGLPGPGLTVLPLSKSRGARQPAVEAGNGFLDNGLVRMTFEPGGTCLLTDHETGVGYRCLRFLDKGDRGDTYNFDPIPDEKSLCEPERVVLKTLSAGPVAAAMEIRHRFRIPEGLHSSRQSRSRKLAAMDLTTRVTMYRDSKRVDFQTSFVNNARDHRLQAAVRIPFELDEIRVESAFGVVTRQILGPRSPREACDTDITAALLGTEGVYTTSPHKSFALAEKDGAGIALMNRGLAEIDALKLTGATRLALTLVRAVGWLSRGDLAMRTSAAGPGLRTPGAQCPMPFTWDYALMPYAGEQGARAAIAAAHGFAYPTRLALARGGGSAGASATLVRIDNPLVRLSALRPLPGGAIEVRLVNYSDQDQAFTLTWSERFTNPAFQDLLGHEIGPGEARLEANQIQSRIGPAGILTVRLEPAAD